MPWLFQFSNSAFFASDLFCSFSLRYCIFSGLSSLSLSISIGSDIASKTVTSLSKSIDFTDPSIDGLFHSLLYFPVDFRDPENSVRAFHWFVLFNIKCTFIFFLVRCLSFQLLLLVILLVETS